MSECSSRMYSAEYAPHFCRLRHRSCRLDDPSYKAPLSSRTAVNEIDLYSMFVRLHLMRNGFCWSCKIFRIQVYFIGVKLETVLKTRPLPEIFPRSGDRAINEPVVLILGKKSSSISSGKLVRTRIWRRIPKIHRICSNESEAHDVAVQKFRKVFGSKSNIRRAVC